MRRSPLTPSILLSLQLLGCSDASRTTNDDTTSPDADVTSEPRATSGAASSSHPRGTSDSTNSTHVTDAGVDVTDSAPDARGSSAPLDGSIADGSIADGSIADGSIADGSTPDGATATVLDSGTDADLSPGEEEAGVCAWTTAELLEQVNIDGTYALDCGELGYSEEGLAEGIECVLAADGDAGARFVNNQCPDCLYQYSYLHLSGGEFVLLFHNTALGEPDRHVSVKACSTFDPAGACSEEEILYECQDKESSSFVWGVH